MIFYLLDIGRNCLSIYFSQVFCINLNAWNVHTDVTAFAQDLVLVLVLESEVLVLVLVLGTQVLVLVLGEKSLLTTLLSSPKTPPDFSTFKPASESEISKILFNCPNKQCDSDPIPTWLLKECSALLVPTITNIVNLSLSSGNFHHTLKESLH